MIRYREEAQADIHAALPQLLRELEAHRALEALVRDGKRGWYAEALAKIEEARKT